MYTQKEMAQNYVAAAKNKVSAKWYHTFILAMMAGAFIAFGAALATAAGTAFVGMNATLVKGAVFPLGLILVIIAGSELFTGNNLLLAPVLAKEIKLTAMLKNLGIVYLGNLVGSIVVALLTTYSHVFAGPVASAAVSVAAAKCSMTFVDCMLRGVLCNILVCLAVWASFASKTVVGKILVVYLPVFAFVVCGFEHSVANMYYLTSGLLSAAEYGIAAEGLTVGNALLFNLLPATIGNLIGGMVFVALPYKAVYFRKEKTE